MKHTPCLTALLCALALTACQPEKATPAAASAPAQTPASPAAASGSAAQHEAAGHTDAVSKEDPAFKADALALLKQIEEIGAQSSAYLDSEEMRNKVEELKTSKDPARRNSLSIEIYRSNIQAYQDAVAKLQAFKAPCATCGSKNSKPTSNSLKSKSKKPAAN